MGGGKETPRQKDDWYDVPCTHRTFGNECIQTNFTRIYYP
jgi:hypothetical protein